MKKLEEGQLCEILITKARGGKPSFRGPLEINPGTYCNLHTVPCVRIFSYVLML